MVTLNITGELRLSGNGTALEGNGRLSTSAAEAMLIVAGRIVVDDRSVISSTTFQDQPSGLLFLSADSIQISGGASIRSSTFGGADGGTIAIETPLLSLSNAGSIFTLATGSGPAGQVVISADTIQMDSDASIDSNTSPSVGSFTSTGPGGDVLITTRVLDMRGGAVISSATVGGGPAGSVSVIATESVTLSGNGSGINSPTVPIGSGTIGGNGGLINVITSSLRIENGASVRASTATTGTGGEISVGADQIEIVGHDDPDFPTGISSRSFGQFSGAGRGGDLVVVAGRLHLTNGGVVSSAATGVGDAGSVRITADDLSLDNGGQIATSADNANGGLTAIVATRDITLNSNARHQRRCRGDWWEHFAQCRSQRAASQFNHYRRRGQSGEYRDQRAGQRNRPRQHDHRASGRHRGRRSRSIRHALSCSTAARSTDWRAGPMCW